ncbi:thiosulfate sulfurtransferase 16, chloroplastic-like [Curcuma longa]|uniref:thiosulfate sulfurtransferase 16, chloroplastic-like n=1 Tax=Curcuma longa TaxID=136217 RepID=UPI003D9F8E71
MASFSCAPPSLRSLSSSNIRSSPASPGASSARRRTTPPLCFRRRNELPEHRRRQNFGSSAVAGEAATVPMSVPVRVARELLQAGHHYLDIRTVDEFTAGHPTGAVNVPYMLKAGSGLTKNPNFLVQVLSAFSKDDEIIIGCQSGRRSLMAAVELASAGFTGITDVEGGFSLWVQNRLPVDQ